MASRFVAKEFVGKLSPGPVFLLLLLLLVVVVVVARWGVGLVWSYFLSFPMSFTVLY